MQHAQDMARAGTEPSFQKALEPARQDTIGQPGTYFARTSSAAATASSAADPNSVAVASLRRHAKHVWDSRQAKGKKQQQGFEQQ